MERLDTPAETIREAVAAFDDPDALQAAVSDLQSHGFDRADISFMAPDEFDRVLREYGDVRRAEDNPTIKRAPVVTETDVRQGRVLAASLGSVLAAFAAAGFTVMTGGAAAVAAAAAAAAAGGVGALGALAGRVAEERERRFLEEQARRGGVVIWVRLRDAESEQRALEILRRHGGHDVHVHAVPPTVPATEA